MPQRHANGHGAHPSDDVLATPARTDEALAASPIPALDLKRQLGGKHLLVLGGTGFLGKIFWIMMLHRFPEIGKIYLLVRKSAKQTSEQRFWKDIATSEAMEPLKQQHGDGFEAFLREKVVPVDGDVGLPNCGIDVTLLPEKIDAVVNVAGVVDFNPPLDEALDTNAFGAQNLVALSRALGDAPLMHTSTCYTVGNRQGLILEETPGARYPFPRADELGRELWSPEREITDCLDIIAQAKSRCEDAFRQSEFLERAMKNLVQRGEPTEGAPLAAELKNVKRKWVSERLVAAGIERAEHWGWPNIYTYTKSIGEQIIVKSGIPYTIARPACCESTMSFPFPSWNEGIGTSAPIIYLAMQGVHQVPLGKGVLDYIPADMVASGMILTLAELLEGTAKPVYQYGTSDTNPMTATRSGELTGLYKRLYFQKRAKGNPLTNLVQQYMEPAAVTMERFDRFGAGRIGKVARAAAGLAASAPGPLAAIGKPAASALRGAAAQSERVDFIFRLFAPFTTDAKGPFSCANTRAAYARLSAEERALVPWHPETLDWMDYWMGCHMPAMEKRILPWMDDRYRRELKPLKAHHTLSSLVDQMAERHAHSTAFGELVEHGIARTTYLDVQSRANATAARLAALGVQKGDRVVLTGHNSPDWPIAFFGIVRAGATAVPVDPAFDAAQLANVVRESGARHVLWDAKVAAHLGDIDFAQTHRLPEITAAELGLERPEITVAEDDVASLIFTSGTTGTPKGVKLTHANFTAIIAALAPLFPLGRGDRVLSVLPLHHTFEFTCGLLLPFSRGARVVYLDELKGDKVGTALKQGRITAMVGVPAVWQLLERRILSQVKEQGPIVEKIFHVANDLNRQLAKSTGVDLGKVLFGPVHAGLGGNIKYLISGGAALPKDTQQLFAGLGFKLTEGYGLTEAAPVLTVAKAGSPAGQVGKPIPGVTIKIDAPDETGVGEVLARGPNVMAGYTDEDATKEVLTEDGWLRTGDLGKLDRDGRLVIVGRVKDVIVTATGENVYPDDIERMIGKVPHVTEYAIVGVTGKSGGERVGCIAVPEEDESVSRKDRLERAQNALRTAIGKLPYGRQPTIVHLYDAALPKTATRKVKRSEARKILERMIQATARQDEGEVPTNPVRVAIAAVKDKKAGEIRGDMTIGDELGFDSLSLTELLVALEAKYGAIEPKALMACRTVADVEALVGTERMSLRPSHVERKTGSRYAIEGKKKDDGNGVVLPAPLQETGKKVIGKFQDLFYGEVMRSRVTGEAFIPHNRNTIVVANHASHLDMGFVRHALGTYGEDIVSLAAQDYFFEKNSIQRAFFENLTNLKAVDRKGGLRASERQAGEILTKGKTLLIFPEGTRSTDGELHEFKPLLGHLALHYNVDILPLYIAGAYQAMPKGSKLPTSRQLEARIGPPITTDDMRRLTKGLTPADASREVAKLAHRAVAALKDRKVLDVSRIRSLEEDSAPKEHPLVTLFAELEGKFQKDAVEKPTSFYFTLGNDDKAKWTVTVTKERCEVKPGKPQTGSADCVLKTSPEIFTKIVRDAYTPSPTEFMSGAIKSNDIGLLMTFQKVFALS